MQDDKSRRERSFPLVLIDKGLTIRCRKAKASVQADLTRILEKIGDGHQTLDNVLHGVVAKAGLRFAIEAHHAHVDGNGIFSKEMLNRNVTNVRNRKFRNTSDRRVRYLDALRNGKLRKLSLDLKDSSFEVSDLVDVLDTLNPQTMTQLTVNRVYTASGNWLHPLTKHRFNELTLLDLSYCEALEELPEGIWEAIPNIKTLDIQGCHNLRKVPPRMKKLRKLTHLSLSHAVFCPCKSSSRMHIEFPKEDRFPLIKQSCVIDCGTKSYHIWHCNMNMKYLREAWIHFLS